MLLETIRGEGSGIVAWILRWWETSAPIAGRLNQAHLEKPCGRVSQQWLEGYAAEAGKHDAGW